MGFDHLETEYHLTPEGWIEGTEKFFGEGQEKAIPSNRIETWLREEEQSSGYSSSDVTWRIIWPEGTQYATNKALRDKFPAPGKGFPS